MTKSKDYTIGTFLALLTAAGVTAPTEASAREGFQTVSSLNGVHLPESVVKKVGEHNVVRTDRTTIMPGTEQSNHTSHTNAHSNYTDPMGNHTNAQFNHTKHSNVVYKEQ